MKRLLLVLVLSSLGFAQTKITPSQIRAPSGTASVTQFLTCVPSSTCAFSQGGVVPDPQTGTTYTIATTDRLKYVSFSNASAIAVTLPQAGTSGFANNYAFVACDIGAGTATITPTTSTISSSNGTAYTAAAATLALTTGQCAWIYSDNTNYFAIVRMDSSGATLSTAGQGYLWNVKVVSPILAAELTSETGDYTSANLVRCIQFVNPYTITIRKILFEITTGAASTTVDVGLYSAAGALLVNAGGVSAATTGIKNTTISATVVNPAPIYFCWTAGGAGTVTNIGHRALVQTSGTGISDILNTNAGRYVTAANAATAGVLPATLGALSNASAGAAYPPITLFEP